MAAHSPYHSLFPYHHSYHHSYTYTNLPTPRALLTSELQEIFANAPLAPNSIAHAHVREAHARATGKISADAPATPTPAADTGKKRIPGPEDDCPICYDGMHGVPEKNLVFCEECGNALHGECFAQCTLPSFLSLLPHFIH